MLLIGLRPIDLSLFFSHSGLSVFFTFLKYLPAKAEQILLSCISILIGDLKEPFSLDIFLSNNSPIPAEARSRAIPFTPRQSCRFGVIPISITVSYTHLRAHETDS